MRLKNLLLPIAMALVALFVGIKTNAQTTITVGTGTSAGSGNAYPIYRSAASSAFNYSRSAMLYTTSNLASLPNGAIITGIAFNKTTNASLSNGYTATLDIWMKNSSATAYNGTTAWSGYTTGATQTFHSTTLDSTTLAASPWLSFTLTTPFTYTGGTLEVLTDWAINSGSGTGNASTGAFTFGYTTASAVQVAGTGSSTPLTTNNLSTTASRINNIQITYMAPSACSGTPLAGVAQVSNSSPCAGNSVSVSLSGGSAASGITYQLQSSPDSITFTNVGASSTSPQFTATPAGGVTYYRIVSTCTSASASTPSAGVKVTGQTSINSYPFTESFPSSGLPACWTASNGGTSTYNWTGTAADATYGAAAPFAGTGFAYLYVYLASTSSNPYTMTTSSFTLTGAAKQLQYYYFLGANGYKGTSGSTGTDPYPLEVEISTNGGTSWTSLYQHSSANSTFATSNSINNWSQNTISLAAYTGQTVMFRFKSNSIYLVSGTVDQGIDEFMIMDVPSCPAPTSLTVSGITSTGATLSWTASTPAPALGYRYEVRTSGAAGSGATGLVATGTTAAGVTTATVSGLSPLTNYTFYVRSRCSATDSSIWTPGRSFTTACATFAAPFVEGFNIGALPSCWTNSNSIGSTDIYLLWRFGSGAGYGTTSNGRPAGTYAWVDASSPYNAVVTLTSPVIDLSSLAVPYVKFDWFKNNTDAATTRTNNNLMLEGYNGSAWVQLFNDTSNANAWRTVRITLPASFNGASNAQFRFSVDKQLSNNFYDDVLLDSFSVVEAPTCFPPSGVTASNIQATSATLSWTASIPAPAQGYQYEVRSSGAAGSGTTGLGATGTTVAGSTSANASGLSPATTYTVYVRGICGPGDSSAWMPGSSFQTPCLPISTYPYVQSFATSGLPACWSAANNGTSTYNWTGTAADATHGASAPFAGTGFAYLYVYLASTSSNPYTMTTSSFTLSGAAKQLQYYYFLGDNGYKGTTGSTGTDPYPLEVEISTNGGTTWTSLYQHSSANSTFATSNSTSFWTQNTINLAAYAGQTVTFRFKSMSNYSSTNIMDQGIDEFMIMNVPSCPAPTSLAVSGVTSTGATLSWTASTPAPGQGYRYEVRSSGAAGSGATGLVATGTTAAGVTTVTVSGLSATTNYTFYVRSRCSATDSSIWTSGRSFTTACATFVAPFAEGFNIGNLPNCWTNSNSISSTDIYLLWRFGSGAGYGTTSNGRPAGTYAWVDASSPYNAVVTLTSPVINLAGLAVPFVKFDWFKNNTDAAATRTNNNLKLEGYNGSAWVQLFNDTSNANAWRTVSINLPASFNGVTNAQFRFSVDKQLSNNFYDDVLLDSFSVASRPVTCNAPTGVTVSAITANSATVSWTAPTPAPAGGYQYRVNSGTVVASGATAAGITTANITGLAAGSSDTVYVRSICTAGDTSIWTAGVAFQTTVPCTPPVVNLGNDTAICIGSSLTLNAGNAGSTYLWSNGATTQSITVATAGSYSVRVTNAGGCIGRDTINVIVSPLPVVNLGNDTTFCAGGSKVLSAGNTGATYLWSTGATTQSITASTTGSYSVRVTTAGGCIGRDTINVTVNPAPVVNLGNDTTICGGNIVTLNAGNAGATYLWSTGATTQSITVSNTGSYSVRVTNANGCIGRDTINVTASAVLSVNLGNDTAICTGSSLTLNAGNAGATYLWSTGATTQAIAVSTAGSYSVRVTTAGGCVGRDTINVTLSPLPVVNLGNDTTLCGGNSVTLNAGNAGATYLWNTGATTRSITASATGSYSVRVTTAGGCIGRDTINVIAGATPVVNLGNDTTICTGASKVLNAGNAGATYLWSTGATTQTIAVSSAGTYSVTVRNASGCMGRDTIVVSTKPTPNVNLGNDTTICVGNTLTLNAGNVGATYLWNTGATTQTLVLTTTGFYSVAVTGTNGCVGRDTVRIMVNPLPVAGTMNVINQSPTFTFSTSGASNAVIHGWRFGDGSGDTSMTATHTYTTNGTYAVTFYVANSCGIDSVNTVVHVNNAGINTVSLDGQISLFPNPANDFVTVQNTASVAMKTIRIMDVAGAVVGEVKAANGAEQRLGVSHLAAGTYLLRIEMADGAIAVRRMQVKH